MPEIAQDARPAILGEAAGHTNYGVEHNLPLEHFQNWFPMTEFFEAIEKMNAALKNKWPKETMQID